MMPPYNTRSLAYNLANGFPHDENVEPKASHMAKLINKMPSSSSALGRSGLIKHNWQPKRALTADGIGMFTTRVALLISCGNPRKAEELIRDLTDEQRLFLTAEASVILRCIGSDANPQNAEERQAEAVDIAFAAACYFCLLLLIDDEGYIDFWAHDKSFRAMILPVIDFSMVIENGSRVDVWLTHALSRIEAFARIAGFCNVNAISLASDPSQLFSDGALTLQAMPICLLISKIPQNTHVLWNQGVKPEDTLIDIALQVFNGAFVPLMQDYHNSMPKLPPAFGIREDILKNSAYQLWPGISEIQWREKDLRCIRLMPMPDGTVFAVIRYQNNDKGVGTGEFERMFDVPRMEDTEFWAYPKEAAEHDSVMGWCLSPILEAIRMCVAPTVLKIRDGRVPSGYVSGERKPSAKKGDVPIVYLPKVRTIDAETTQSGDGEPSAPTGITHKGHQVAGFLRQLRLSHKASEAARIAASEHGLQLPESGFTFVRPHSRGIFKGDDIRIFRKRVKENADLD
ncbi:hypothetical protein FACS1894216_04880 [Synergistales bacterium]|nr:hypothetical protein FACS1894216_04880 [Synergistales bacterium]